MKVQRLVVEQYRVSGTTEAGGRNGAGVAPGVNALQARWLRRGVGIALLAFLASSSFAGCASSDGSDDVTEDVDNSTPFGMGSTNTPPDTPTNPPADAPPASSSAGCSGEEFPCEVFELVNQERATAGRTALLYNSELARAAYAHARDMAQQDYFDHQSLDGRSFSDRVNETSYTGFAVGENIAGGQRTPESVMTSWMDSPGHRDNILAARTNEIGVGFSDGLWVQVFGRKKD